jgi:hypothetical protein
MTTIAYKDGIVAVDSLSSADGIILSNTEKKIFKLSCGIVVGCGLTREIWQMVRWLESATDLNCDQPSNESTVLLFTPKEITVFREGSYYYESPKHCFSWGSGYGIALGAMAQGATAITAVKIACKLDIYSGGKVKWAQI